MISLFMLWQELERRLALQEQDVAIVKTVKSEVARVPSLEKELKRLRDDNAFLRSVFKAFQKVSPFNRIDRLSFSKTTVLYLWLPYSAQKFCFESLDISV